MIQDDIEIIHDSTETGDLVRLPRKVLADLIDKQKKYKLKKDREIPVRKEENEEIEEDDFASYYNPDLNVENELQR